jgi:hypothetical protein
MTSVFSKPVCSASTILSGRVASAGNVAKISGEGIERFKTTGASCYRNGYVCHVLGLAGHRTHFSVAPKLFGSFGVGRAMGELLST